MSRLLVACLAGLACLGLASAQGVPPAKVAFWIRVAPDQVVKFDPETDQVVKTLQNRHGISSSGTLSHSKKELYLVTGQGRYVEVIDLERGETVDEYDFGEDGWIIRVDRIMEVPGNEQWWVRVDRIEKKLDHFVIQKPQWWLYDVREAKVEKREAELPKELRRGASISPDGTHWHVSDGGDLKVLDPKTLEEVGKIELSKPLYTGLGALRVQGEDLFGGAQPGRVRRLYTMRDPVKTERTLMGAVTLDLENFEVSDLDEWGASPGVWGWRTSADGSVAVGIKGGGRRGGSNYDDPELVLYTLDLKTGKRVLESRIASRNGLRLAAVSATGDKIYFAGRGHELVVHDAEHAPLKTVELPGELDGSIFVVPE